MALTVADMRLVFRLVGECCDLGADPCAWREHLVRGLVGLLRCDVTFGGRVDLRSQSNRSALERDFSDAGWDSDAQRAVYREWIATGTGLEMPVTAKVVSSGTTSITAFRRDWIDEKEWYSSELVQRFRNEACLDDVVFSFQALDPGRFLLLVGQRSCHDRRFGRREAHLLDLLQQEIVREIGRRLETFEAASLCELTDRQRVVLRHLLEGQSEKEIACRLGISPHTVHVYVKQLHRYFRVGSRGELLARCRRYWDVLQVSTP